MPPPNPPTPARTRKVYGPQPSIPWLPDDEEEDYLEAPVLEVTGFGGRSAAAGDHL